MTLLLPLMFSLSLPDLHSFGNYDQVTTTHLSLKLKLDFEKRIIDGTCTISLTYLDPQTTYIDLDTFGLTIFRVTTGDGVSLAHELRQSVPILGQCLRIPLKDHPSSVVIEYRTEPGAEAVQWLNPQQTTSGKMGFLFTQSQSIYARTWIPCIDSPGVRVTYDALIEVPAGMTAVMSAQSTSADADSGKYQFRMPQAIPPYLIALAAGELAFQPISPRTGVYAEPQVLAKAVHEFADAEKMILAVEKTFGPYDWGRWDILVLPPSFPFGGMENPRLTFATPTILAGDRSLVNLLAHELAHSWSGNLVTNATWEDIWLNEGFTTYLEYRILETLYGLETANMQAALGIRDLKETLNDLMKKKPEDSILKINLTNRNPDEGLSDISYEKGAALLRMMEHHFGRARFDRFLVNYFGTFRFKTLTTATFATYLKKQLFKGDEATWKQIHMDQWLYEPGLPPNFVEITSQRFDVTKREAIEFAEDRNADDITSDAWVTQEWLNFLRAFPPTIDQRHLASLDQRYKLSLSGNSEILFAWFMLCIEHRYEPAYPALSDFLTRQGRTKFLEPLYRAMTKHESTQPMAREIYAKARPTYHPLSQTAIDAVMK